MAFWNDPSALYPKQSHRWVVSFGDSGNYIEPHYIKSIDRPSYEVGSVQAKMLYSHVHNFPKRVVWKPIKIEFYDLVSEASSIIGHNVRLYRTPNGLDTGTNVTTERRKSFSSENFLYSVHTSSGYIANDVQNYTFKQDLVNNLNNSGTLTIIELDAQGKENDKWILYKPFISSIESGKLDYSNDNILTINATVVYDYAEHQFSTEFERRPLQLERSIAETDFLKYRPDHNMRGYSFGESKEQNVSLLKGVKSDIQIPDISDFSTVEDIKKASTKSKKTPSIIPSKK